MLTKAIERTRVVTPYQLFMLVLCVWALVVLSGASFLHVDPATQTILDYADTAVCLLFLTDFLYCFAKSPRRFHYFITWGWIDLLSSVPAAGVLRFGRAARLLRILRVLRGIKSARTVARFLADRRQESAFLVSLLLCLLILVSSSIAILQFEVPAGGNITTPEAAMWWALSTMSTVGSGEFHPTTTEGRFVGIFLVACGVGAFGMLSGFVASWFLSPGTHDKGSELAEVKAMVAELQSQLRAQQTSRPRRLPDIACDEELRPAV